MKTLLFVALSLMIGTISAQAEPQSVGYETLGLGEHSGCTRPAKMLITNQTEWQRVWRVHSGKNETPPAVDWSRQCVVALMSGNAGVGGTIQLMRVVRDGNQLTLYVWHQAGTGRITNQPYHFAAVPLNPGEKLQVRFADAAEMTCPTCVGEPPASSAPGDQH